MRILIDTHALLWAMTGDVQLSAAARQAYLNADNDLFLSAVSFWEICLKVGLGKLSLSEGWSNAVEQELKANGIQWLPITVGHCLGIVKLPFHHRDPFDRMLVAQALTEDMSIMTADKQLSRYSIPCLW